MLFPTLPAGVCPFVLPVFFEGLPRAHFILRNLGIQATAWDGVKPSRVKKGLFGEADFLYENLTFLPVHQDLERHHLALILEAVKRVASEGARALEPSLISLSS